MLLSNRGGIGVSFDARGGRSRSCSRAWKPDSRFSYVATAIETSTRRLRKYRPSIKAHRSSSGKASRLARCLTSPRGIRATRIDNSILYSCVRDPLPGMEFYAKQAMRRNNLLYNEALFLGELARTLRLTTIWHTVLLIARVSYSILQMN